MRKLGRSLLVAHGTAGQPGYLLIEGKIAAHRETATHT